MQPLPVSCPAHLIPDATGTNAFHDAYRNAMAHNAVFVAIEAEGQHWTVKADTLTAGSGRRVADAVNDAIRAAIPGWLTPARSISAPTRDLSTS